MGYPVKKVDLDTNINISALFQLKIAIRLNFGIVNPVRSSSGALFLTG